MDSARPESTIAIILAASEFPKFKQLDSASIARSAKEFSKYLRHPSGLFLPGENILELIDDSNTAKPADVLETIVDFLKRIEQRSIGARVRDLLFYYVGHGDHVAPDGAYHLFLPKTDERILHSTSLSVAALADVMSANSRGWRRYMIVDACFAGASTRLFEPDKFGSAGGSITILCAAGHGQRARAPQGAPFTMFSAELLSLLWNGSEDLESQFSVRAVGHEVTEMLRARHGNAAVLPEVHHIAGDAADVDIFPNRKQHSISNGLRRRTIFTRSDSPAFHDEMESLMRRARRLVFVGMGLNVLQREPLANEVMKRAADGDCDLEIYLANPDSPDVQTRLIEEELGAERPAVGRRGLRGRLTTFYETWLARHNRANEIKLRVFPHYPAFALIIADEEYFIYPYGCRILGNFSPVLRYSSYRPEEKQVVEFLDRHYREVKAASLDLDRVLSRPGSDLRDDRAHSLAVYFIPPQNSSLYRFGVELLGYDVWNQKQHETEWTHYAGTARNYGFHLTIADALYFRSDDQLKVIIEELKFGLNEFPAFELIDMHLETDFPAPGHLSLTATDVTGNLEAMHYDFVSRIYRRAESSDYTLGLSSRTSSPLGSQRDAFMTRRFRAPHILQAFRPHLTLLTGVPQREQEALKGRALDLFEALRCSNRVRVEELQVMTKRTGSEFWRIRESIQLG